MRADRPCSAEASAPTKRRGPPETRLENLSRRCQACPPPARWPAPERAPPPKALQTTPRRKPPPRASRPAQRAETPAPVSLNARLELPSRRSRPPRRSRRPRTSEPISFEAKMATEDYGHSGHPPLVTTQPAETERVKRNPIHTLLYCSYATSDEFLYVAFPKPCNHGINFW